MHKTTVAICKNKFWLLIISLFTIWSLLICLNYSSLIDSVASLAKFYVYSVNYQHEIPIIANPRYTESISSTLDESNANNTTSIREETEEKTGEIQEETEAKTEETGDDEIDKILDVNMKDLVEDSDHKSSIRVIEKSDQDEIIKETAVARETMNEKPQQIPTSKKKKRKGRPKRRKPPKNLPNTQVVNTNYNQESSWNNNVGEEKSDVSPPPPPPPSPPPPSPPPPPPRVCKTAQKSDPKSCSGRYIFVHTLPRRFNVDLLRDCKSLDLWMDMCEYVRNSGLGPELPNSDHVFSEHGWFATNQFLLEVIFHNRMKQYDCLTNDSSIASAIFVPFYTGLDVARHLWNTDSDIRDSGGFELVRLLKRKPEWKRWWGRDHFFAAGRITWDFRRSANKNDPYWGTKFLYLPEAKNMTGLVIESSPWNSNDFRIHIRLIFTLQMMQRSFNGKTE
ncbi:xyloglucan galactosyltransferase MUR3-like [Chenopodium quinoa]|uniref:xyloglucan galactosyltransferase MUR3-like n=1 Tax=Chenopodium quinoa TaxID=63459 RepID=UPI000B798FD2|nr:xyloglucan galactosyltransferase MUR3-like [Chenopodium quinoa]